MPVVGGPSPFCGPSGIPPFVAGKCSQRLTVTRYPDIVKLIDACVAADVGGSFEWRWTDAPHTFADGGVPAHLNPNDLLTGSDYNAGDFLVWTITQPWPEQVQDPAPDSRYDDPIDCFSSNYSEKSAVYKVIGVTHIRYAEGEVNCVQNSNCPADSCGTNGKNVAFIGNGTACAPPHGECDGLLPDSIVLGLYVHLFVCGGCVPNLAQEPQAIILWTVECALFSNDPLPQICYLDNLPISHPPSCEDGPGARASDRS